jgi:hypothetical protein
MREKIAWRLAALLTVLVVPGCGILDQDDDTNEIEAEGVVEFVGVEGGCWTIRSGNVVYEPIELPEEMKIEGLAVEFEGDLPNDLTSICQVGTLIDLEEIEVASGS